MNADFFSYNRRQLAIQLGSGVIVLTAHSQMQRNNDMAFPFEQDANFWYLTGIEAPDWRVIIDTGRHKAWLVAPHVSAVHQVFDGSLSNDDASKVSGISSVITQTEEAELLHELAKRHALAYAIGEHPQKTHFDFAENPAARQLYVSLGRIFESVHDCRKDIVSLRAIKQPEEIRAVKKAVGVTVAAFRDIKEHFSDYKYEYEIEATFDYHFKRQGLGHAYDPIVAAGKNACTLHYTANRDRLKQRQLVLMDVGARYQSYAADITRTYIVGTPTDRQIEIHGALASAHKQIINLLKPRLSVLEYHRQVDEIMRQALASLNLMRHDDNDETYRRYFPHAISHGLGIDTHDALGSPQVFEPGMVLTVEPGIYIPEENIGIRIEDDILITEHGHGNLSAGLSTDLV